MTNGHELPPQRHRAHGGLTEGSTIYYPLDTARNLLFYYSITLDEPLKSLFPGFADGTDIRRPVTAAEVAADETPPNGHG